MIKKESFKKLPSSFYLRGKEIYCESIEALAPSLWALFIWELFISLSSPSEERIIIA